MTCCCGGGPVGAGFTDEVTGWFQGIPNTAQQATIGLTAANVGTITARPVTAADVLTNARRVAFVSAAAINSVAGTRSSSVVAATGITTPGSGRYKGAGWLLLMQWAITDAVLNTEGSMFWGMRTNVGAPTTVDPTTIQGYAFGHRNGDATLRFLANDGATSFMQDLGANFPIVSGVGSFWRARIFCPPGQTGGGPARVEWAIERLNTGHVASGSLQAAGSSATGTLLTFNGHRSTGPVNAAAVAVDHSFVRIESQI